MVCVGHLIYIAVAMDGYVANPSIMGVVMAVQPLLFLEIVARSLVGFYVVNKEAKENSECVVDDDDTKKYMKKLSFKDSASFVKLTKTQQAKIVRANKA